MTTTNTQHTPEQLQPSDFISSSSYFHYHDLVKENEQLKEYKAMAETSGYKISLLVKSINGLLRCMDGSRIPKYMEIPVKEAKETLKAIESTSFQPEALNAELLEALQRINTIQASQDHELSNDEKSILKIAQSAIAKAEGNH